VSDHLSPADLDVLLLASSGGIGGQTETAALERHLLGCPLCRDRREQRAARHAQFERDQLPHLLRGRRPAPARFPLRAVLAAVALAPAAALALFLIGRPAERSPMTTGAPGVKGVLGFRLIARRGDAVFEVPAGARLQVGDALRFVLEPVGRPYLLIASLDGKGRATIYHPFGGARSVRVPSDGRIEAPSGSVVLDDTPGPERVFALWSDQPLQAAAVLPRLEAIGRGGPEAIRATTQVDVPGSIQTSRLFEKGETP
jgi:hypothetical protein